MPSHYSSIPIFQYSIIPTFLFAACCPELVAGLAAVFLHPLCALGKWWGEPGIETQEVGGEASPGQIQGKENADTIGKDIGVGECTIPSHALKKFQAHAHYKEPNAQPQLRGPLRIDVSKP